MSRAAPRVLIAGTGSGCGKTSVTCALLGALRDAGHRPAAFKCGPDYIDPMFHRDALGVPSRNLDLFLCGRQGVRASLARHTPPDGLAVLEGAMGLYDGIAATDEASAAHVARETETPVVLVLDARGKGLSLAAELRGFLDFAPGLVRGVILNRIGERGYGHMRELLQAHCPGVELLGFLPPLPAAELQSRHLGLVTAGEIADLRDKLALLTAAARQHIDVDRLLALARVAPPLDAAPAPAAPPARVRVGIARDRAFCFYYQDALDLLERLGAELVPFSPLDAAALPPALDGLLLGGGYPELHAARLAANRPLLDALRDAVRGGLPTVAECGGFLLLCERLRDPNGTEHRMAGALPVNARMTTRLQRFGYQTLTARRDTLLLRAGESLPAHEFHYAAADDDGDACLARKAGRDEQWSAVHASGTLWAGFAHLHLGGSEPAARRFVEACARHNRSHT